MQGSSKDTQPTKPPSQQPPKEAAVQGSSEGKKPEKAATKESVPGSSSKDKQPPKPSSEQPLKEEAVTGTSKGKKPQKSATKESVPVSSSNLTQPPKPPSEQPSKEEAVPGTSKGKKPRKSAPGASKRKQSIQLPPGRTKNCMEYPKLFPIHILGSYELLENTDPSEDVLPSLSDNAKGKQPAPKTIPLLKIPRVSILRIPVARDGLLKRVKVSIRGDTAIRHWQTFFFKNVVCLEPFWGETNDKAFVATRIVRLMMKDGKPTPYFLMVCIGEFPRITSPRNDSQIFKGLLEPIYDAFVFKLGDPELGVAGYANYVDIDKDFADISWLRQAIRNAARKVERATARHANPGFPDMSNYADEETMSNDVGKMLYVMAMIAKANKKYADAGGIDAISGLPDLESMRNAINGLLAQTRIWKDEGLLSFDVDVESAMYQATNAFGQKTIDSLEAIEEAVNATKLDQTPSASTDVDSPSAKTKELWERAEKCYMGAESDYEAVKALVTEEVNNKVRDVLRIKDPNTECDTIWLKYMANSILSSIVEMKKDRSVIAALKSGDPYMKRIDQLGVKAQAAYQAIEENKTYQEIIQLVIETNEIYQILFKGSKSEGP